VKLNQVFENCPDLLSDESKLKSVFADFYGSDISKINRMMKAYEIGVLDALVDGKDFEFDKNNLISRLVNLHDMQTTKATEAINEWCVICSKSVISAYKKYVHDKQEELVKQEIIAKQEEAKLKAQEARKQEQKQKRIETEAAQLSIDFDNYDRYINPDLTKGTVVRGIPCGVGKDDYGFVVRGTGHEDLNNHDSFPSVYALVYNFLVRDTHITRESYPQYMKENRFNHELNYGRVYRYMMILLDLLKPEGETVLYLNNLGDKDELSAATDILNEYLGVFCRLTKFPLCSLRVVEDLNGKSISVEEKADYYVENHKSDTGLRRRLRYGNRVNYSLDKTDKADLEFILKEISPFTSFKRGQYEALCSMMNANGHAVCIMPTGSGKSLIYYFACLLQPQVVFVVSPTDILIKDQIRNLRKFHHFDNAGHLILRDDNDFAFYNPGVSMNFLTPSTFQNRNLFGIFKRRKKEISYVVLDEVHCLSSWGHDFRPEYLMLSKNMCQYLEDARYLGFTATANYTVAQDIQKQLGIPLENFFSPVLFEKYNVKYDFREVNTTEEMFNQIKIIANDIVHRNMRAIVFTKSDDISVKVADAIGYEADVFTSDKSDAYIQFAKGLCSILVASEELGIGINLPDVNCTVHFGMPISKNEFVQEIGRAGRADEKVTSYVVYLKPSEENIPGQLLKRDTMIDNISQMLQSMDNDYADVYNKLNCGADTSDILFERLIDVYSDFHSGRRLVYEVDCSVKTVDAYKQLVYMLFVIGYVKDWYTDSVQDCESEIKLIVDICSVARTGHSLVPLDDASMLERMIKTSREYFASMGNDRESVFKVSKATSIEGIIHIYANWYYNKFLYHHKEQFLDCFEFITGNKECNSMKITEEIEDYFTLPFIQIKEDEEYYSSKTLKEMSAQAITGIGKNTLSNLERINSNHYSYRIDYLLFIGNLSRVGRFDVSRLERFWSKLSDEEKRVFFETMASIYPECSEGSKLSYLQYVDDRNSVLGVNLSYVVDMLYEKTAKDTIYYGVLAKVANEKFKGILRSR
jgi:superfamily II DNA or RNA helicase